MATESSGDKAPPPYLIQTEGQGSGVKVYHVHTPFNPPESTISDGYQVQTSGNTYAEPKQKFVSYDMELGRSPGMTTCTSCQTQVMTNVTYKVGTYAWLMCILFILCGLVIGCCLIPFFVKFFKDAYHTCPRCNRVLHVDKKKCC
ncbi:lipopolysaccharide-induced tumor necrosis factor-alpha factor homolog-like isoform X2 [Anguilla rostrata]|nr:cell death-inducing p53-target protein 1 homolog [Anguilla anguilla]